MEEIWKPIPNYERYLASNLGRIKTLEKTRYTHKGNIARIYPEKIMLFHSNDRGYLQVSLSNHNGKKCLRVNRLIAMAFLENENNLPQVNHINGIKTDNKVDNLEWCDQAFNNKHARDMGLNKNFGNTHHQSKLKEADVTEIRRLFSEGKTQKELSLSYSVTIAQISNIVNRKLWKNI